MNSVVIIPALNPSPVLPAYARQLLAAGLVGIVVVDDGSEAEFAPIFAELEALPGVTVLKHAQNRGKGRALKTAIEYILGEGFPYESAATIDGVVTADADGQHTVADICRIAALLAEGRMELVLGRRNFSLPQVPLRSRLGNRTTSMLFWLLYGTYLPDTQTGLRGIPWALLPQMLQIEGERFDYEMRVLVDLARQKAPLRQADIETRYFDHNRGSHYDTWSDTMRVARVLFKRNPRPGQPKRETGDNHG